MIAPFAPLRYLMRLCVKSSYAVSRKDSKGVTQRRKGECEGLRISTGYAWKPYFYKNVVFENGT